MTRVYSKGGGEVYSNERGGGGFNTYLNILSRAITVSFRLVAVGDDVVVGSRPVDGDGRSTVVVLVGVVDEGELTMVSSDIG